MANPQKFANKTTGTQGLEITPTVWENSFNGIQAEWEDRMEAWGRNGIVSGFACTISGTTIAIASGEAYCEGKRYAGASSVDFDGEDAGTYYVYIDPTSDSAPFKAKTTVPSSGELCLCQVAWNGTTTLSALVTGYAQWGLVNWKHSKYAGGSCLAGLHDYLIVDRPIWLETVKISLQTRPTTQAVIVDIHAGDKATAPATIWTTTAYRPQFLTSHSNYEVVECTGYIQANRSLDAGDIIEVWVDQTCSAGNATGLTVCLYGRYM